MEVTEYYAACLAIGFFIVFARLVFSLAAKLRDHVGYYLKSWCEPLLPTWTCGQAVVSRYEAILFLLFIVLNGLCIGVGVNDSREVTRRLGCMILINFTPLFCGAHMNHIVSRCGIRYERYSRFHIWLGVIVIIEVALHTALAILQGSDPIRDDVAGLLASCSIGAIAVFSIPIVRRWVFELFVNLHSFLSMTILVALWLHLPPTPFREGPRLYLLLSSIAFVSIRLLRLLNILYSSISFKGGSVAMVKAQGDGVEIRIRMARPLNFKAGQYVYLSLWGLSIFSALQSHPFQICWAYQNEGGHQVLVLLAQPRRGFTRNLLGPSRNFRAFIEGPYGKPLSLGQYGTVLLVATGVGIVGQLAYIKELLELYHQCQTKTRRIALLWELDAEAHRYWVRDWMDELLALDTDYILDMQLYIRGQFLSKTASEGTIEKLGSHGRITLTYTPMRPDALIHAEIEKRKGNTLISLCTNSKITRDVMGAIRDRDKSIHVKIMDFQPWIPVKGKLDIHF